MKRSITITAAMLSSVCIGIATASAAPAPSAAMTVAFTGSLNTAQQQQFAGLSPARQNEMVTAFNDPAVFEDAYTPAQLAATYPNLTVTDSIGGDTATGSVGVSPAGTDPLALLAYTIYNVHSWYHHTVCELFLCNTASLDFYYQTGNNRVLTWQKCTWHDSGFSFPIEITNISTSASITSGNGHCSADVQLTELYHLTNGYLDQGMSVNYHGIYSKSFKQVGP